MMVAMRQKPKPDSPLISFDEAGALMGGLHPNTIRQRKAGTDSLTHVSGFGRRVFLIRSEVIDLVDRQIALARAGERERRKGLRLVAKTI